LQTNPETIELILALSELGLSSRKIAHIADVSKSTVNNYIAAAALREHFDDCVEGSPEVPELQYNPKDVAFDKPKKQGPRILFYDLEVAGDIGLFFGRHKINISQEAIVKKGGFILCASWKNLGEKTVDSIHLTKEEVEAGNDSRVVEKLRQLYRESDAVICHNSKGYDHKVLQARSAYWDFPALPVVKVLDTLELAKRNLRLPSNKLGSIAAYFNLPLKMDHSGISLWVGVQSGDVNAMTTMVEYCKQDVVVLEEVYNKLKQTGKAGSDFNAAMYFEDNTPRCRTCGSDNLEATGRAVVTSSSTYDEYVCLGCGSVHRGKVNKTSKEKRKCLLV